MTFPVTRNRLGNAANPHQGRSKKVLCVCSAGLLRSPTTAWVLSNDPFNFNTRAVGTAKDYALVPIDGVHVAWADDIIVMDDTQKRIVEDIVRDLDENLGLTYTPTIHVFNIPDNFGFRDPQLVEIITDKCHEIFKTE